MLRPTLVLALALAAAPALGDEFEEVMGAALEAYRAGEIDVAREELDYARRLLEEAKAEGLVAYLPEPLPGWRRETATAAGAGAAFALIGGATTAAATYTRGSESFTLTIVANSPMVSGMAAMISGLGSMAGRTVRIQRQEFSLGEGEMRGVVGGRVLVEASGDAPLEDMQAHVETMDLRALAEF